MELDVLQYPPCPSLVDGKCVTATQLCGVEVEVTAPVCNVTCKMYGPYCGQPATDLEAWKKKMLFGHRNSVSKVWREYGPDSAGNTIVRPAIADEIIKALAVYIQAGYILGVGLTGSAIFQGKTPTDIDPVLIVGDYREWLETVAPAIIPTLPETIGGLKADYWVKTMPIVGPFAVLNLLTSEVYIPPTYKILGYEAPIQPVNNNPTNNPTKPIGNIMIQKRMTQAEVDKLTRPHRILSNDGHSLLVEIAPEGVNYLPMAGPVGTPMPRMPRKSGGCSACSRAKK